MKKDNEKRVPELRFKGFDGDWEQRKLGEVFQQTSNYVNPTEEDLELWSLTVEQGLTPKTARYDRSFLVKKYDQFKQVSCHEFLYNPMNMTLGAVDQNNTGHAVAVSGYYTTMKLKPGLGSDFFRVMLRSSRMIHKYKQFATGSLIERQRVQFPTFSMIPTNLPDPREQESISKVFKTLDAIVALHERKLELLKELKKAYLQQLFPENGQLTPKLRLAGYTDDWEKRKLSWMLDARDGIRRGPFGSALKKSLFVPASPYVVYEQQNAIYDKYNTRYNISEETFHKLSKFEIHPGDFIMSGAGTIGRISRVPEGIKAGVFNQALIRFKIDVDKTDDEYFLQLIRSPQMQRKLTESNPGSAITNLVPMSEVKNWVLLVPTKVEQTRIAHSLRLIDKTIALHQRKLETFRNLKKAYLQRLFI